MMHRNIHRSESTHGKTADCSIRGIGKRPVVRIDIPDEIDSNGSLHELVPIEAIAPYTRFAWSPIAIGENQNQFRDLPTGNQGIGGLIGLPAGQPVVLTPR